MLSKLTAGAPSVFTVAFSYRSMAVTAEKISEKLKAELQTAEVVCLRSYHSSSTHNCSS